MISQYNNTLEIINRNMVLRTLDKSDFRIKIDGKWLLITTSVLENHPGGSAILAYKNKDASTVFHTFHGGSKIAYKQLEDLKKNYLVDGPEEEPEAILTYLDKINIGEFNLTEDKCNEINKNFNRFRMDVRRAGYFEASNIFFIRKFFESIGIILISYFLQYNEWYILSALCMGLAWQQLGWMIHDYTHNQHFKNHWYNDISSYIVGNFLQGFSSGGWKEQHNVHHVATNVVGRDGDLDLLPFWATVASDLKIIDLTHWTALLLPYQHIYWAIGLPFLRLSWLVQSFQFVISMSNHFYKCNREKAIYEQIGLLGHWTMTLVQLYYLPNWEIRIMFFIVSQIFGGFLLAHVVTYNHYSTDKFNYGDRILETYACLQLYTTRNMRPGIFIDWLWGGLNYQIEHHLFPTMPRHNLSKVMPLVKKFCKDNDLPYMVDDYYTGWVKEIEQMRNVAVVAKKMLKKVV
uniref:FA_desaturase domain-containing protein n=1 Tax=Strongyloides stercoralis TaxID=6248 RepID=A0AAF5DQH5_STRER